MLPRSSSVKSPFMGLFCGRNVCCSGPTRVLSDVKPGIVKVSYVSRNPLDQARLY